MKIEQLSEDQIRCTISGEELSRRQISIQEFAYGSYKAKLLFAEMLSRAQADFGFMAEDVPLMVEAVPLAENSLMLLVTKISESDEIDPRFSRFLPVDGEEMDEPEADPGEPENSNGADDILTKFANILQKALDTPEAEQGGGAQEDGKDGPEPDFLQAFRFSSLDGVCRAAHVLYDAYDETNTLFKDPTDSRYYLVLHKGGHTPETFNKTCNILSEYGAEHIEVNPGTEAWLEEHCEVIVAGHAVQSLKDL